MSWSKDQVLGFLAEEHRLGRLATVGPNGQPHVVPIWFKVVGDTLQVHTIAESRKAKHIQATGQFALVVDKDTHPYKGVSITGTAHVAGEEELDWRALIMDLARAYCPPDMAEGYGQYVASMPGEHVTLVLTIHEWEAWDYSS